MKFPSDDEVAAIERAAIKKVVDIAHRDTRHKILAILAGDIRDRSMNEVEELEELKRKS